MLLERIERDLCTSSARYISLAFWGYLENDHVPMLEVSQPLHQNVKVNGIGRVKVVFVQVSLSFLFWVQRLVE